MTKPVCSVRRQNGIDNPLLTNRPPANGPEILVLSNGVGDDLGTAWDTQVDRNFRGRGP